MLVRENYKSKKELKRRLSQIRKVYGSERIAVRNVAHIDRLGRRSKSNLYNIEGIVKGKYHEYKDDEINGYIEYYSEQKSAIPPREEVQVKDDAAKVKAVKSAKQQVEKEAATRKGKDLFTADEIEAIRAVKKDEQLLGKNKSDTARRIVIKYYDTKTDKEMLDIAKKIWTESNVQNNLIQWHHRELIDKGIIKT